MTAQAGILFEHCKAAIYLEAKIADYSAIAEACKKVVALTESLQQKHPDAHLYSVIAFGYEAWQNLSSANDAQELKSFTQLGKGNLAAPATQNDLLIHILSLRHDVNFSLAQLILKTFESAITVVEENHGFRWVEDRDLTGFIDGTENPAGETLRRQIGLVQSGIDQNGSYVFTQRWEHQLDKWEKLDQSKQEQVIGRTKPDSVELDDVPPTSHVGRVDLKENGKGLKILRQSLPYGTASGKHGLYFISYCGTLHNIEQQLLSMFGEIDGKTDRLLGFTKPVTGSYYFAPSLERLLNL
ncbi:Dyp-type peroxidase [Gallibacterium trehalosifermentans]|uniref:Dyp-type peroxidase n=1 Tax=Gallibacterium trehalosifermentans TaxID=516935 RepID=A0ABV6H474_9PAST